MRDRGGTLKVELQTMTADAPWIASHPEFKPGAYVRLSISDTGHGMEASTQERIFEPFFTTKAPGEGTGLGLAIVHGIMRAHEGIIQVYSQLGQGSVFHLYFPVVEGEASSLDVKTQEIPLGNGQAVLVVDDEPAVLGLAKNLLSRLNYRPQVFLHPLEAVEAFRRDPGQCQIVLTDLTMPKLSGLELARQMHQIRPEIPIILSTGFSGELTQEQSRQAGIGYVLRKPYNLRELAQALHASLPH
jgi:CheY-like chemotaxis protein